MHLCAAGWVEGRWPVLQIQDDAGRYPLTLAATAVSGIVEDEICMLEELGIKSIDSLNP